MVVYKVNPSFSLTLGYPPEDMEGSHSLVLFIPMILIKQIKKLQIYYRVKQLVLKIDTKK
jgi:hypothetical protein